MRLLKAYKETDKPYQLFEFPPDKVPPYAILSHTWGSDEVSFADIKSNVAETRAAYEKVHFTCEQAKRDGLDYVWIDTCCIDKSSSAELSEAINSMYLWYSKAEKCYAYMADVSGDVDTSRADSDFVRSKWFTRGWTLQELIAPPLLIFYSDKWDRLGQKITLSGIISEITGIDEDILVGKRPLESASIATRMSWAARRVTTRPEDIAYSMMGIFSVNMPMLYGEGGEKAFLRLQEEVMKYSDDQSIFAWIDEGASMDSKHGLLAKAPANFRYSNAIIPYQDREERSPFSMSNRGLCIDFHLTRVEQDVYVAAIDCPVPPDYEDSTFLAIYVQKLAGDRQYARVRVGQFGQVHERGSVQTIYVRQKIINLDVERIYPHHVFQLRGGPAVGQDYHVLDIIHPVSKGPSPKPLLAHSGMRNWIPTGKPFTFSINKGANQLSAAILLERHDKTRLLIMLGSSSGFQVAFDALDLWDSDIAPEDLDSLETLKDYFVPKTLGTYVKLDNHRVRVSAEPRVHSAMKYYMVDLQVEAILGSYIPIVDPIISMLPEDMKGDLNRKKTSGTRKLRNLFGSE